MFHDKNNEILKKLIILHDLNAKRAFEILINSGAHVSFNTVRGWLYHRDNKQYRKMPYNMLVLFLDAMIEEHRAPD